MKKAFTLIELIFVIVIAGILAIVMIPKSSDTKLLESANQLITHIRYAKQLAINSDQFDPNDKDWYKKMWRIEIKDNKYTISRGASVTEKSQKYAPDPAAPGKYIEDMELKSGVKIDGKKIFFDELGRVYTEEPTNNSYQNPLTDENTTITLCKGSTSTNCGSKERIELVIQKESGYIFANYCTSDAKNTKAKCQDLGI